MKISAVNILLNIFHYPWRQIGDDDSIFIFGRAITLIILCCFHYSIIFSPCLCSRRYNEYHSDEQFLSLNNAHYVLWFCVLTLLSVMTYADSSMNLHCIRCDGLIENTHTHTLLCVLVKHAVGGTHSCSLLWQLTALYDAFDRLEFSRSICLCRSDCIFAPGTARGTACHQCWTSIRDIILLCFLQ